MIRIQHVVLYDDHDKVRLTITNEDPAGGWTRIELDALIDHLTGATDTDDRST